MLYPVLIHLGHLHFVLPQLNLSIQDAGILIMKCNMKDCLLPLAFHLKFVLLEK